MNYKETEDAARAIVDHFNKVESAESIAKRMGVTEDTVMMVLAAYRYGWEYRNAHP